MVPPVYRLHLKRTRESAQFRELYSIDSSLEPQPLCLWEQAELEAPVKPFSLLKLPVLLVGFGGLLLFSPACKAQSEVNPDHFDGTDPWEVAARTPVTPKAKPAQALASYQAKTQNAGSGATVQLAAVRDLSMPVAKDAGAVQDKRKPAVRKSDKE